jgi:hypothetical protein
MKLYFFELKTLGEAPIVNFIKKKTYLQEKGRGNVQEGIAQKKETTGSLAKV